MSDAHGYGWRLIDRLIDRVSTFGEGRKHHGEGTGV